MSQTYDISNPDTWQPLDVTPKAMPEQSGQAEQVEKARPLDIADPGTWEELLQTSAQAGMRLNFRAGKITPDQAHQAWAMTQKTQLPQSAVLSHMEQVRDMLEEQDLDALGLEAPLTSGWMAADVIRTNVARDDTAALKGMEKTLQRPSMMDIARQHYEGSAQDMDDLKLWERHMAGERTPDLLKGMREAEKRRKEHARKMQGDLSLGEEFVANTAEQLPIQAAILKERARGFLIGPSAGALTGSFVPGVGTLAGAAAGYFVGPAAYSASEAYRLESLSAYRDYRQDGIPDDAAALAARVYGVGAAVVEFADSLIDTSLLGFTLDAAGKQAVKMTVKTALSGLVKNISKGKISETAEEVVQQGLQIAVGEVTKVITETKTDQTLSGSVGEVLAAGWKTLWSAWGAESAGPRFALDLRDASRGGGAAYLRDAALAAGQQREQELLSSIDDLSAQSKLAQRDPQLYEEAVRAMRQDGAVQHVYIPAGGLAAALGGSEALTTPGSEEATRMQVVLDMLGLSGEDMAIAMAGGTDLVIPIEKYAAAVARDKEFAALIANDRRLTADGFTVREMDQWTRENESVLRDVLEASLQEGERQGRMERETKEISFAVQAQLEATGVPRDQAVANAAQMTAVFGTLAQRTGKSPLELWKAYAPNVAREGGLTVEAEEVLPVGDVAPMPVKRTEAVDVPPMERVGKQPPRHVGLATLEDVYTAASQSKEGFQSSVAAVSQATGGRALFRPGDGLKSKERAQSKVDRDYGGKGVDRVVDVLGGTVLYNSRTDIQKALPEITKMITESGGEIVRIKNRFTSPSGGYKDILINVRMPNGLVTEILVTTEAMAEAKNGIGHKLYEAIQLVDEMLKAGDLDSNALEAAADILKDLEEASVSFYASTGDQSNATASSSVITYPLINTSANMPLLAGSSVYPQLESVLATILNSLPSSEKTNGMSSYSLNRLTITGMLGPSDSQGVPTASLPSTNNALNGAADITQPPAEGEIIAPQGAESNTQRGASIAVILADGTEMPGRYELREAGDIIPSHDALHNFEKREDYPADTQERPYHSNLDEQLKVRNNAANLNVAMVINNNPDAVNGPPIVTEAGVVLGGNSRAMSLQLVYAEHGEHAQTYKDALKAMASIYGLDPEGIDAMQRPMLVRVLDGDMNQKQQARLVRVMNQNLTQGLNANAEAVSRGRLVSPNTLAVLAAGMEQHDTLAQYLAAPASRALIDALDADGVLEATQRARLVNAQTGLLNDDGRRFVQLVLRGRAIQSYDTIDATPLSVLQTIDRILPQVAALQSIGGEWDITPILQAAVRQIIHWKASGYKQIGTYFNQASLLPDAERDNNAVRILARQLVEEKPTKFAEAFSLYTKSARNGGNGLAVLPGVEMPTPTSVFEKAFGRELAQDKRGEISLTPSGRSLITLFQKADASTFLHESGHLYLEMLRSLGTSHNAVPEIAALWQEAQTVLERLLGQRALDEAGNISAAAHELWASSLENYFMKGEAPNMELRGVFQKFGAWLKAVYNAFRSMRVQPTEELDAVFQRLFATDEQIAEVAAWHEAQKPWADILQANAAQLEEKRAEAEEEAKAKRLRVLTRAYMDALGGRKRILAEAKATVEAWPVYAALDEAARGQGLERETLVALLGKSRTKALTRKRPGIVRNGGEDPLFVAARHGFESTEAMLEAMLAVENKSKAISRLAAQQEKAIRDKIAQGIAENESMPGDAEYHSDAQLSVLLAEKQLLDARNTRREQLAKVRDTQLLASALREVARKAVAALPVAQATQAHKHSLAERRAAKAAWAEAKAGNWEKAAQYKQQEAVSHAMYMASMEARARVEKGKKAVTKLVAVKTLSADARDIMHDIAYRFGILHYAGGNVEESYAAWQRDAVRDKRDYPPLRTWADEMSMLGYPVNIEEFMLDEGQARDYRQLSLFEFESIIGALRNVYTVDRLENTAMLNGRRVEIAELAAALEAVAAEHKNPSLRDKYKEERLKETLGGIHAKHAKMEAILLDLDGWEHGVWWETLFKPIADAENAQNSMLRDITASLQQLAAELMPGIMDKRAFFNERHYIKNVGNLTMNQIVAVALNCGNAENRQRLMDGEGWTKEDLKAVLAQLEEKHCTFVNGLWEYLETFKEPSFALQREVTGVSPKAVEAEAFMVTTRDGKEILMQGGYYPIAYSAKHGDQAYAREQKDLDKQLFGGRNYGAAMTKHGHLKARASKGTGERLNLDIGVVADHLYNTAHDISHRKPVIEVAKLMRNKSIIGIVKNYAGPEVAREFVPWVQDVANEMQARETMAGFHKLARWVRRGTSVMAMGLKVTTMVTQLTGISQTAAVLGPKYAMLGLRQAYARDGSIFRQGKVVMEQSVFMANRLNSFDREVRDATKNITLRGSLLANAEKLAYLPIGIMQFGVDVPTWLGAKAKALAEGKDEAAAITYADSIVRITQTSGGIKDLARIQRGSEVEKLFTMFYSFFSALYQLAWRAGAMAKNEGAVWLGGQALLLWFVPSVLSEIIAGRGPDEDDGEEWAPWMVQKIATYPTQMIIGLRELVGAVAEPKYGYKISPATATPESIYRFALSVQKALEEEDPTLMVKPGLRMMGHVGVLPLGQPSITIGNMYDYMTGETPDFQLRDLVFVKQKSRR